VFSRQPTETLSTPALFSKPALTTSFSHRISAENKKINMAVGIGRSPTGSWADVDRSDWSGFYSDAIQQYIIDYFTVDGEAVDPYDGAVFSGGQLDTLCSQLRVAITGIQAFPLDWPFEDSEQIERYYSACRAYDIFPHPPRDQALRTLRECITLATKARQLDQFLVFCGD
jgi:hypothetical protein